MMTITIPPFVMFVYFSFFFFLLSFLLFHETFCRVYPLSTKKGGFGSMFEFCDCIFFFFFGACVLKWTKFDVHVLFNTVHALFMEPTATLFKENIKNGSHGTIHIFKNYFVTVFSVFSFQFSIFSFSKISFIQTDPNSFI